MIFTSVGEKNREEIGMFLFEKGEKIRTFGQNIYPCSPGMELKTRFQTRSVCKLENGLENKK